MGLLRPETKTQFEATAVVRMRNDMFLLTVTGEIERKLGFCEMPQRSRPVSC